MSLFCWLFIAVVMSWGYRLGAGRIGALLGGLLTAAGLGEELLFRGLMQRRLLQRLSPAWAISISSVLFAVTHIDPAQSAFALPLGVWFGVIAWRTGSVWPSIIAHTLVNMTSCLFALLEHKQLVPEALLGLAVIGLGLGGTACFVLGVVLLAQPQAAPPAVDCPNPGPGL